MCATNTKACKHVRAKSKHSWRVSRKAAVRCIRIRKYADSLVQSKSNQVRASSHRQYSQIHRPWHTTQTFSSVEIQSMTGVFKAQTKTRAAVVKRCLQNWNPAGSKTTICNSQVVKEHPLNPSMGWAKKSFLVTKKSLLTCNKKNYPDVSHQFATQLLYIQHESNQTIAKIG